MALGLSFVGVAGVQPQRPVCLINFTSGAVLQAGCLMTQDRKTNGIKNKLIWVKKMKSMHRCFKIGTF